MSPRRRSGLTPLIFIVACAVIGMTLVIVKRSTPQLGLDLQGGVSVVLQPKKTPPKGALKQAIEIIRTRVDALGVAEPEIAQQGSAVVVQLPGVKNQRRALEIVGQTAELRFRPVLKSGAFPQLSTASSTATTAPTGTTATTAKGGSTTTTAGGSTTSTSAGTSTSGGAMGTPGLSEGELAAPIPGGATTSTTAKPTTTTTKKGATTSSTKKGATTSTTKKKSTTTTAPKIDLDKLCPVLSAEEDKPDQIVFAPELDPKTHHVVNCYELGPSQLTGAAISTASARVDPNTGEWSVSLVMKGGAKGIDGFNALAAQCNPPSQTCPTGQLAIVLDGVVKSAPTIQTSSFKRDQIQITGNFSQKEAKDLALVLKYGALPIELEPQTVQTVSASLGKDSLHAGLAAGIGGLILVALYMILYYRALGMVVIMGLAVWGSLNFALICFLSATQGLALSLSGVTGIIVSVGVTVDSYVVYFERLKDELKAGRTLRSSTERSFKRAFRTILAADISAFIGAALLYWLTVGPVRGFAFFLGLATILDVTVAWFFTRPMVGLLAQNRVFTEARFLGVARGLGQASAAAPAGAGR
jgi:preprotein translocase subunit SecD